MTEPANPTNAGEGPQFAMLRTYLKDVSFETPNSPAVFMNETEPKIRVQINTAVNQLEPETYEVVVGVTATAADGDKTSFLVEVQQAGIFALKGFEEAQKNAMLGAYCPTALFPFARETVADLVAKGGFPQLLLAPVNFDALYAQKLQRASQNSDEAEQRVQ